MQEKGNAEKFTVIVGIGKTGFSCANYLSKQNKKFAMMDSRKNPPYQLAVQQHYPKVEISIGGWNEYLIAKADELLVSPGVALSEPFIQAAKRRGVTITSDVDLFCQATSAPIAAITGSNGKSTVTTLLGEIAKDLAVSVGVGGNLGTPVLDLLNDKYALYVLELSSFQLENAHDLKPRVAALLNVSEDHMDRYPNLSAYQQAKQQIFSAAEYAVFNRDDPLTTPQFSPKKSISFGLTPPQENEFGVVNVAGELWLAFGEQRLLPCNALYLRGMHNVANVLAALAMGVLLDFPLFAMLETVKKFEGLAHRCQKIATINGVEFFNDSKGTNVGAAIAAIQGLAPMLTGKIILIAGGDTKGADFSALRQPVDEFVREIIFLGKDTTILEKTLLRSNKSPMRHSSMQDAVEKAFAVAHPGDGVLLSPACASFDLFKDYQDRGNQFIEAVKRLQQSIGEQ